MPLLVAMVLALSGIGNAEPPTRPLAMFDGAKKVAPDAIYRGRRTDFYCGCEFAPNHTRSGATIYAKRCGYMPRKKSELKHLESPAASGYRPGKKPEAWRRPRQCEMPVPP